MTIFVIFDLRQFFAGAIVAFSSNKKLNLNQPKLKESTK